jgi:O-antigen ligase
MKFLDLFSKILFVLGMIVVCMLGTAVDVPFHLLGLPLCGLGAALAGVVAWREGRLANSGALPWVFFGAVAYLAIRAAYSPVRHLAEMDLFLLAALVSGFCMTWFVGRVRWVEPWLWLVAIAGAVVGVIQVTVDDQFTVMRWLELERPVAGTRASGFFFHPNPSGTWSAMLLLASGAALFLRRDGWVVRVLAGVACLGSGVALLLSFCRAAFLGASFGLGVVVFVLLLVVLSWKVSWWKRVLAGMLVLGLLVGAVFAATKWLPVLAEKRTRTGEVADLVNIEGRFTYWRTGLSQFLDSPLHGTGARTFSYLSYQHWDRDFQVIDKDPEYVHSEYVQALADYGFLGLVSVLAMVVVAGVTATVRASGLARQEASPGRQAKLAWCLGAIGAGGAFLGDVVFSFSGHFAPMVLLLGIFLGGLASIGDTKGGGSRGASWKRILFATGLGYAVLAMGFLVYPGMVYGWAAGRVYWAQASYNDGKLPAAKYLEIAAGQADRLDRYPLHQHAATFGMQLAPYLPEAEARAVYEASRARLDRALSAFPQSLEARLLRAEAWQALGQFEESDADFAEGVELGKKREYYHRGWMRWGEARYQRGLAAWRAGNREETKRWLLLALEAYDQSKRLAWISKEQIRYVYGRQELEDFVAFLKRTKEW